MLLRKSLSRSSRALCAVAIGVAVAAMLAGCPGTLEDPARFETDGSTCPDIPTFFTETCALAGCHSAQSMIAGLDLASPNVFQRLLGKHPTGGGGTGLLIDPSNPADSVLYTKLTDTPPFPTRMPASGGPLSGDEIACVLTWIETNAAPP
jgi:hypothetical protein